MKRSMSPEQFPAKVRKKLPEHRAQVTLVCNFPFLKNSQDKNLGMEGACTPPPSTTHSPRPTTEQQRNQTHMAHKK